jgi:hypothetical protein
MVRRVEQVVLARLVRILDREVGDPGDGVLGEVVLGEPVEERDRST